VTSSPIVLTAACQSCFALCCTALPFARSADFAIDKPSGTPCLNLLTDDRCRIHSELRANGFPGCVTFDCFGAGQHVSQGTFAGVSWREERAAEMFAAFEVMRQLHELLWYLADVRRRMPGENEAISLQDEIERLSGSSAATLSAINLPRLREAVDEVLTSCSEQVRSRHSKAKTLRNKDLLGRRLTQLRGAYLRGALLIAADLSEQDLTDADLLGADLRDADLAAADLTGALFLTQAQVNAARGDRRTRLPAHLQRPVQWP
jgi:hypothetical protein